MTRETNNIVGLDDLDHHYMAEVLADSESPEGVRLTTFKLCYPRFIHSEMMTHRMLSRNAASSRAIPTERLIDQVRKDPFIPAIFNKRVKGMGVGEAMNTEDHNASVFAWLRASINAADSADELVDIGLDKSRANRILEPFLWYTAIFSGTEWDNFLALRDHEGAQPEIQAIARCIKKAFADSTPRKLRYNQWHLPLVTIDELARIESIREDFKGDPKQTLRVNGYIEELKMISASRCARVSFDRTDDETWDKALQRAEMLMGNGHFSPFEHVARPIVSRDYDNCDVFADDERSWVGNFNGWFQMRKEIPNESRFDLVQTS